MQSNTFAAKCLNNSPLLTLALVAALTAGCAAEQPTSSQVQRAPLTAAGLTLAPRAEWQALTIDTESLVTPRWSPDGRHLEVRGTRGRGLFVMDPATAEVTHADAAYRGDSTFTSDGAICFGERGSTRRLELAPSNRSWVARSAACDTAVLDGELGERVASGDWGAIYHDAYAGTVIRVSPAGEQTLLEQEGAWGVAVSTDGRRVAWSLGTLSAPQLLVHDESDGYQALDRGAHASWSPDGRYLVFTRPEVIDLPGRGTHRYDADLFLYDATTTEVTQLTRTADAAEMQPAFSPDGGQIAFSDWEGNAVYLAPLVRGEGGQS